MRAASDIVAPVLLGLVLAITMAPLVDLLRRKGLPGWLAWIIVSLGIVGVGLATVGVLYWWVNEFALRLPTYQAALADRGDALSSWLASRGIELPEFRPFVQANARELMRAGADLVTRLISSLYGAAVALFLAVLFLIGAPGISSQLWERAGSSSAVVSRFAAFSQGVHQNMLGMTFNNLATALAMTVWLILFRVDFAVMWGLLAFFLGYVPNVGMFLAAVPPILLALILSGLQTALIIAVGLIVIIVLFNFITNVVLGQAVDLSPAAGFIAFMFWAWVLGPLGTLLAYPLTVAVKLALESNEGTRWLAATMGSRRLYHDDGNSGQLGNPPDAR